MSKSEVIKVDVERAGSAMEFMADWVKRNPEEVMRAEAAAKDALMGLILTAVASGLVSNGSPEITQLRSKIMMAFNIGYYHGKLKSGLR
jgi:hypothetical protein